jgi:hypothetical protein
MTAPPPMLCCGGNDSQDRKGALGLTVPPNLLATADEGHRITAAFAAAHESGLGTQRRFAAMRKDARNWG